MTNPCQDPTPEQEAIYERDCEIAALKEQIVEAYRIIEQFHHCLDHGAIVDSSLLNDAFEYMMQNESIVKECAK